MNVIARRIVLACLECLHAPTVGVSQSAGSVTTTMIVVICPTNLLTVFMQHARQWDSSNVTTDDAFHLGGFVIVTMTVMTAVMNETVTQLLAYQLPHPAPPASFSVFETITAYREHGSVMAIETVMMGAMK